MPGIEQFLNNPGNAGLLQGAFQGMRMAGPSRMPVSMGQGIGAAGSVGLGAFFQAQDRELKRGLLETQIEGARLELEHKRKYDDQSRAQLSFGNVGAGGQGGVPNAGNIDLNDALRKSGSPWADERAQGKSMIDVYRALNPNPEARASLEQSTLINNMAREEENRKRTLSGDPLLPMLPRPFSTPGTPGATPGMSPQIYGPMPDNASAITRGRQLGKVPYSFNTPTPFDSGGAYDARSTAAPVVAAPQQVGAAPQVVQNTNQPSVSGEFKPPPFRPPVKLPGELNLEYGKRYSAALSKYEDEVRASRLRVNEATSKAKEATAQAFPKKMREIAADRKNEITKEAQKAEAMSELSVSAISSLRDYRKATMFGTGPFATVGGLRRYTDEDLSAMEAKFQKINLTSMVETFKGMSRAIDSEADRAAWERTQPNIKLDDKVNAQILVGAVSMSLKSQAEAKEQSKYIDEHETLEGYQSPVIGKVTVLFDPTGKPHLVHKDMEKQLISQGMITTDMYAEMIHTNSAPSGAADLKSPVKFRGFKKQ